MNGKYKVIDWYDEQPQTVGYADTLQGVKKLAREFYNETDGECAIYYMEVNPETKKYKRSSLTFVEEC